jgi:hypothetical protein
MVIAIGRLGWKGSLYGRSGDGFRASLLITTEISLRAS